MAERKSKWTSRGQGRGGRTLHEVAVLLQIAGVRGVLRLYAQGIELLIEGGQCRELVLLQDTTPCLSTAYRHQYLYKVTQQHGRCN